MQTTSTLATSTMNHLDISFPPMESQLLLVTPQLWHASSQRHPTWSQRPHGQKSRVLFRRPIPSFQGLRCSTHRRGNEEQAPEDQAVRCSWHDFPRIVPGQIRIADFWMSQPACYSNSLHVLHVWNMMEYVRNISAKSNILNNWWNVANVCHHPAA